MSNLPPVDPAAAAIFLRRIALHVAKGEQREAIDLLDIVAVEFEKDAALVQKSELPFPHLANQ